MENFPFLESRVFLKAVSSFTHFVNFKDLFHYYLIIKGKLIFLPPPRIRVIILKIYGIEREVFALSLAILLILPLVASIPNSMGVWIGTYVRTWSVKRAHRMASWALDQITDPIGWAIGHHTWYTRLASIALIAYTGIGPYYAAFTIGFTVG